MNNKKRDNTNSPQKKIVLDIYNSRYLFDRRSDRSHVSFSSKAKTIVHSAIASLGDERAQLSGSNDCTIEQILIINRIYSRRVATPRLTHGLDFRPGQMIVFDEITNEPYLLLFTRTDCVLKRCCHGNLESLVAPFPRLGESSIEVYPSFKATINSPIDIIKLAYANNASMIVLIILISIAILCFGLSIPILSGDLVSHILPQGDMQGLIGTIFGMILIIIASVASRYVRAVMILRLETSADLRLQTAVWERFLKMPLDILEKYTLGELYVRLSSISRIRQQLNTGAITSFMTAIFSLAYLALMYVYDSTLASYVLIVVCVYIALVLILGRASINVWIKLYEFKSSISSQSIEIANTSLSMKTLHSEPFLLDRWFQSFTESARLGLKSDLYWQTISLLTQSLSTSGAALFFSILIFRVFADPSILRDPDLVGNFVAFYVAFISFNTAVTSAAITLVDRFSTVFARWAYCKDLLYNPISVGFDPACFDKKLSGSLTLHEVEIIGEDRKLADHEGISLHIESGQLVCISGSDFGRHASELLQVIAGFRSLTSGVIMFDGIHFEQLTHASMMENIFFVEKNPNFFPDTLIEFLNPGNNHSDQELKKALDVFKLGSLFEDFCFRNNSQMIVDWDQFNAYQKKSLILVRVLLSKPSILLIDDPFFGLNASEASDLKERLANLSMTRIIATSSSDFLESADCLIEI